LLVLDHCIVGYIKIHPDTALVLSCIVHFIIFSLI
jgi:hypothetical protein